MMESKHVRTIIPYLDYSYLRKNKILPKQVLFTKIPRGGKFQTLASKIGYSTYGLFMESIVRMCVELNSSIDSIFNLLKNRIEPDLQKYFKIQDFVEIYTLVCTYFKPNIMKYEPEWYGPDKSIVGHPDLVYQNTVYDIKTTSRFNAMRSETILQVLSYYCLGQINTQNINSIGLVLPAQRKVLKYNISDWDWVPFWLELKKAIKLDRERKKLYQLPITEHRVFLIKLNTYVGSTVHKSSLISYIKSENKPSQFFVNGNASSNVKLTNSFHKQLKTSIEAFTSSVYIHSSYSFNLSNPKGNIVRETDGELPWVCEKMGQLMESGHELGIKGIVIHCGKVGKLESIKIATDEMYNSVVRIGQFVNKNCPLLIETSSGQNGEILCFPEELIGFWTSLPNEIKSKVGICVDTCHVFAAGYDPFEYICKLESNKVPIGLIHYNDSKMSKGSKRDRHASIGQGYIGIKSMYQVLDWAIANQVKCVFE